MSLETGRPFCLALLKSETATYLQCEVVHAVPQEVSVNCYSKESGLTTAADLAKVRRTALKGRFHRPTALVEGVPWGLR
ncbi:MAG: hypothetical protein KatS3mg077_1324 [Candidatus Binatia bacterium]|nr:MAG: hypothetical protein KatS3mg077_1321 [Candidatus Binatia bacterium]GIW44042.1 MAG: hypothetical protein KatS3mg077_1324 [Candidatus Binatia bacterium]